MICNCKDWKDNIDKINAAIGFLFARNPHTYKGYEGKQFIYCPWCSKKLRKEKKSE